MHPLPWPVILASASPRRQDLLRELVPEFTVDPAHIDEDAMTDPDAFPSEADTIMDVDLVLAFFAGEIWLGHWDGYAWTRNNYYVGATVNTPVTGLKAGVSFDYVHMRSGTTTFSVISPNVFGPVVDNQYAWALYLSYQATEKLSLHGRAETIREQGDVAGSDNEAYALTGTVQYNLWENVISRAEIRWDHANQDSYGNPPDQKNAVLVAANIIYKF